MPTATPDQVLESIVTGINSGNLESLMPLYESEAAFATQPGSLAPGAPGVQRSPDRVHLDERRAGPRGDASPRGRRPGARDRRLVVQRHGTGRRTGAAPPPGSGGPAARRRRDLAAPG